MDLLTHLFLPITVIYVLRPDLFTSPWYLSLSVFAIIPDIDKLFQMQGILHSGLAVSVICVVSIIIEKSVRGKAKHAWVITLLLFSHLVLDILDGGPVPLFFPISSIGIGISYPVELIIGDTIWKTSVEQVVPSINATIPDRSRRSYRIINGYGMLSALTFILIYKFGSQ